MKVLPIRITNGDDLWCPVPVEVLKDNIRIDVDEFENPQNIINTEVTVKIIKIGRDSTRAIPVSDSDINDSYVTRFTSHDETSKERGSADDIPGGGGEGGKRQST
ncbi:hypothetical protein [Halanaeroarchaeum sp. HSR-CO]|uniref:hypothetical protein n=1 Tax=Halanaeroarchaeum sp. HSR-CO TaxID=2866382 RepID=UPI00217E7869|nr:hypothetical protein [Halanaeroarchaeum sp. HSR-CO]